METGMVEVGQLTPQRTDLPAEVLVELTRATSHTGHRRSIDPRDGPQEMSLAVRRRRLGECAPVDGRQHTRCDVDPLREVSDRALLRLENDAILGGIRHLEHHPRSVRAFNEEILIALAGQRCRAAVDAEVFARQLLGRGEIEVGTMVEHNVGETG